MYEKTPALIKVRVIIKGYRHAPSTICIGTIFLIFSQLFYENKPVSVDVPTHVGYLPMQN